MAAAYPVPPAEVTADEHLLRRCSRDCLTGNRVKPRAFYASKLPFQISVDRSDYCDAIGEAHAAGRGGAELQAGPVRELPSEPQIEPDPPPTPHANIRAKATLEKQPEPATKAEAEATDLWAAHAAMCEQLAGIAKPLL